MIEEKPKSPENILHKPYWSYDEIIEIATFKFFSGKDYYNDDVEIVKFKTDLLSDLKDAIMCRIIVPVDLTKSDTWFKQYELYIEPIKILGMSLCLIFLVNYMQEIMNSSTEFINYLKPGTDSKNFMKMAVFEVIKQFLFMAFAGWIIFVAYRAIMKYRSKSGNEKFKYLMSDAEIRGFTDKLYESETVIDFLNARYSLKLEKDPFRVWKEPFFKRNGEYLIVGFMGKRLCLREKVGHEAIAYLLSRPNQEFDCNLFVKVNPELLRNEAEIKLEKSSLDEYESFCKKVKMQKTDKSSLESVLDNLKYSREDARSDGRTEDVIIYTEQIDLFERYIKETYTKNGIEKPPRDISIKSRDSIKKAIDRCINDIKSDHPFLAEHLSKTITRSYTLSYRPPENIFWDVQF